MPQTHRRRRDHEQRGGPRVSPRLPPLPGGRTARRPRTAPDRPGVRGPRRPVPPRGGRTGLRHQVRQGAPAPDAAPGPTGGAPPAGRRGRMPGAHGICGGPGRRGGPPCAHGTRRGRRGTELVHASSENRGGGHDHGGVHAAAGHRQGAGARRDHGRMHDIHVRRLRVVKNRVPLSVSIFNYVNDAISSSCTGLLLPGRIALESSPAWHRCVLVRYKKPMCLGGSSVCLRTIARGRKYWRKDGGKSIAFWRAGAAEGGER
mmetsp:Transcript_46570/g.90991  ORF Transcript_46570/g.90991 Transcript_46570/m.90991 type:complete len:260 (-) Transcript_46570:165-944(-)